MERSGETVRTSYILINLYKAFKWRVASLSFLLLNCGNYGAANDWRMPAPRVREVRGCAPVVEQNTLQWKGDNAVYCTLKQHWIFSFKWSK